MHHPGFFRFRASIAAPSEFDRQQNRHWPGPVKVTSPALPPESGNAHQARLGIAYQGEFCILNQICLHRQWGEIDDRWPGGQGFGGKALPLGKNAPIKFAPIHKLDHCGKRRFPPAGKNKISMLKQMIIFQF